MAFSGSYLTSAIQPFFTSPLASTNGTSTVAQLQQANDPAGQQALFNSQNQRTTGGVGMDITLAALAAMGGAGFMNSIGTLGGTAASTAAGSGAGWVSAEGGAGYLGGAAADASALGAGAGIGGGVTAGTSGIGDSSFLNGSNLVNLANSGSNLDFSSALFPESTTSATGSDWLSQFVNSMGTGLDTGLPGAADLSGASGGMINLGNSAQNLDGSASGLGGSSSSGLNFSQLLSSNGGDLVKALTSYLQQSGLSSNLNSAANQAATLNNPMLQPQRLPYQAALLGMQSDPTNFLNTNPLAMALKGQDAQAFAAQAAKSGMGGTSISNYGNTLNTDLSKTYNDQFQNLMTAGGFNQGTGGAGTAAAPLLAQSAGANSNQFNGLANLLSNNSTVQSGISSGLGAIGSGASSLFNDVSSFFS